MTNPQNCSGQPAGDSLEKLESVLASCKARKKAAGHVAPTISCMSENIDALRRGQALDAATKRLQAITAQAKADLAKTAAKSAAAAVVAPRPPVKVSAATSRTARRDAAKAASTFSAGTAENFSDNYVADLARHASTSPADREVAKAELARRGIALHTNGSTTRSTRKI